jgi:hypothetical protein
MGVIVADVQLILNDTGVFWPTQQVLDAVNEAQFWVHCKTKWQRTSASLSLVQGVDIVPIPSSILIPGWLEGSVNLPQGGTYLMRMFPTSQRELEHFLRTWRGAQEQQPTNFAIWDATHFRVFPKPDQSYTYTVWGVGWPIEITSSSQTLSGPTQLYLAVKHYSVGLLLEATRPDLADQFYGIAEQDTQNFLRQLRNQQSHNIRRLRPGKRFDLQQAGIIRELPTYYPLEC